MRDKRKYALSMRFEVKDFNGVQIVLAVFDDLTDDEVITQFRHLKKGNNTSIAN